MSILAHSAKAKPQNCNWLLAQFASADYERLRLNLEPVTFQHREVLYAPRHAIEFVYFIESGVASLVATMHNSDTAEVGTVGNEGFVGLPVVFGEKTPAIGVYVQVAGAGLRMPATAFRQQFDQSAALRLVVLRYAAVFFNQVAQSAACAHLHPLEKRCCRWLMMTRDRMTSDRFALTQEFLAMMLGVRRSSVSVVMGKLQEDGLVRYSRGQVTILDRKALRAAACECYHVSKAEFDSLLGEQA